MPEKKKKKQHYVPRMLLRRFACVSGRTINLFVVEDLRQVNDAPLDSQCYENYFYGADSDVENELQRLESHTAGILDAIATTGRPPADCRERVELMAFVALQAGRTRAAADRIEVLADAMMKKVAVESGMLQPGNLEGVKISFKQAVLYPLLANIQGAFVANDLACKVVRNDTEVPFVISDDPVVRYNQYWEDRKGVSHVGWACQGLQVLMPLTPRLLLLFYDSTVYKVGGRKEFVIATTVAEDVRQLNGLQWANADEVVFFSDGAAGKTLLDQGSRFRRFGVKSALGTQRLLSHNDGREGMLLHMQTPQIRAKLKLSFVSVKTMMRCRPSTNKVFVPRRASTEVLLRRFEQEVRDGRYKGEDLHLVVSDLVAGVGDRPRETTDSGPDERDSA